MKTFSTILSPSDLFSQLGNSDWIIVDCRFELLEPEWAYQDYLKEHIPGAVFADLNHDLAGPITATSGRHPLPAEEAFRQTASRLGIDAGKQVVVYDTVNGAYAARLWWLLQQFGHPAVAVLEGGLNAWKTKDYPLKSGPEENSFAHFEGTFHPDGIVNVAEISRRSAGGIGRIIDARSKERFRGDPSPLDPIHGHIPGSLSHDYHLNLDDSGNFLSTTQLQAAFQDLLKSVPPEETVLYCGSGVTACFQYLAMRVAGFEGMRIFPGSWSEWIRDPDRPVETGE